MDSANFQNNEKRSSLNESTKDLKFMNMLIIAFIEEKSNEI